MVSDSQPFNLQRVHRKIKKKNSNTQTRVPTQAMNKKVYCTTVYVVSKSNFRAIIIDRKLLETIAVLQKDINKLQAKEAQ